MQFLIANRLSFSALLLLLLITALLYGDIPDRLPTNFNTEGIAEESISKEALIIIMLGSYFGMILLTNLLVSISPRKFSMPNSKHAVDIILFGVGLMMCFLHIALLMNGGDFEFFTRYFSYGMALFLIVTGNVFGKTERNFILGLRLPWTFASDANWRATHRFAGRLMVAMGCILIISNSIVANIWVTVAMSVSPLILAIFFSYSYYADHEQNSEPAE